MTDPQQRLVWRKFRGCALAVALVFALTGCGGRNSQTGVLTGSAQREGATDQEGIQVYVPGTTFQALTDSEGKFRIAGVDPGTHILVAKDEGYVTVRTPSVEVAAGETVEIPPITLSVASGTANAGVIEGVMTLEDEEFFDGILITLDNNTFSTQTDDLGKYVLPDIPAADYTLSASKPGFESLDIPVTVFAHERTILSQEQLSKAEPTPANVGSVSGTVTQKSGEPISGVMVAIASLSRFTMSNEKGVYQFDKIPASSISISFISPGYEPQIVNDIKVPSDQPLTVPVVTLTPLKNIAQANTGNAEGIVVLEGADDFGDVQVSLKGASQLAITDSSGLYFLSGIPAGNYDLIAVKQGYSPGEILSIDIIQDETLTLDSLTLSPLSETTELDVEAEKNQPGGVVGRVFLAGQNDFTGIMVGLAGTNLFAMTGSDGAYELKNVPPGKYKLIASKEGFSSVSSGAINVAPGGIVSAPDLELTSSVEKPRVISTTPEDGATKVRVAQEVEIFVKFSDLMDGGSIKRSVKISPFVSSQMFFGAEDKKADHDLLYIRLLRRAASPVLFDTQYTITISADAKSKKGVPLEEPYRFNFTTGGALITDVFPPDGAENVMLNEKMALIINFNTEIDIPSLERSLRIRPSPNSNPILNPQYSPHGDRVYVETELQFDKEYTINIDNRVKSTHGERLENTPYKFSFKTVDPNKLQTAEDSLDRDERAMRRRERR